MKFEGIYTPVITPHRDDGSIDRDAFVKMLEHLIASGVHGIIIGGSTGEYYAQSMDERVEMAKLSKEVIGDRASLIIGTGAIRLADFDPDGRNGGEDRRLGHPRRHRRPTRCRPSARTR